LVIDENGKPRGLLGIGQRKYLATDRVILVPGPQEETDTVREIFDLFVEKRYPKRRIATWLNNREIRNSRGNPWSGQNVDQLLRCERYVGTLVYNRTSIKLGTSRVDLPQEQWVRTKNAIKSIVSPRIFQAAQNILGDVWPLADNDLLDYLTAALCKNGFLSAKAIGRSAIMPSTNTYCEHFGSLQNAYRLIGYKPGHRYRYRGLTDLLRRIDQMTTAQIIADLTRKGVPIALDFETHVLTINNHLNIAIVLVPHLGRIAQIAGWKLQLAQVQKCHAILLGRLNKKNADILDFHLLPRCIFLQPTFRFTDQNIRRFSEYKLEALSELFGIYQNSYFSHPTGTSVFALPVG